MKINRNSVQRSWDKLESFFQPQLYKSPSVRTTSSKTKDTLHKSLSKSPSKFRRSSIFALSILGVSKKQLEQLYYAKCLDLQIHAQNDHKNKFLIYCSTHFLNKEIQLQEYSLGPQSGKVLGEILIRNEYFAYVHLGKNILCDEGVKHLFKGITNNIVIVHLDLSNNNITAEGACFVLKNLSHHLTLYSLNLSSVEALHRNRLGQAGGLEVEKFLNKNTIIGVLNLYGTGIQESIAGISRGIENSRSLISISLGCNNLGALDIKILTSAIKKSKVLIFDLSDNVIGNDGCTYISELLSSEYNLENLNLKNNNIGFKGSKELFFAFYTNTFLKKLDLSQNPLFFIPSEVIYSLENNITLKELNLSECNLKKEGINTIGKMIAKNRGLETLNISNNNIDDNSVLLISFSITKNFNLKVLNLSKNKIKNPGAKSIAEALKSNQGLIEINLKENGIKDPGADELCEVTRVNHTILRLNLEFNNIGAKILKKLFNNLKSNIEANNKLVPIKVKNQLAKISLNKNSLEEVHVKYEKSKKEKEEILNKVVKQTEKFDEVKRTEAEKFSDLHSEFLSLKVKNFVLSKDLETLDKEMIVFFS